MKDIDRKMYEKYITLHRADEESLSSFEDIQKKINTPWALRIILDTIWKDDYTRVLDLACGYGRFATYAQSKGIKDYIGVDISGESLDVAKKLFPSFTFVKDEILSFLGENTEKFDFIYMCHLFEHFELEEQLELLELIKTHLTSNGIFINIMINMDAYFKSGGLYGDITHKAFHNETSLNQLLLMAGFDYKKISHVNKPVGNNWWQNAVHRLVIPFFHFFVRVLGYNKRRIYSQHIISIIKK